MESKKLLKVAALGLLTITALTGCDSIKAKPTNYSQEVLENTDLKIYNNTLETIYDALHDGTLASDVLNEVMYQYAVSVLGYYNSVVKPADDTSITLKQAAASASNLTNDGQANAKAFIKAHKAYWSTNAKGEHVQDDGVTPADDNYVGEREIERVKAKWNTIEAKIAEKFYSAIKTGSFSERSMFYEGKYLASLQFANNKVKAYNAEGIALHNGIVLDPAVDKEDVFEFFLNRENYQEKAGLEEAETAEATIRYVEDTMIPDIYRGLLVEQYILEQTYNTLGRSNAREVNIITIANNTSFDTAAPALMNHLISKISEHPASADDINKETFIDYSNAWTGNFAVEAIPEPGGDDLRDPSQIILDEIGTNYFPVKELTRVDDVDPGEFNPEHYYVGKYYQGTSFGAIIDDLKKISPNELKTDTSVESSFTSSNSYDIATGLAIKQRENQLITHVTSGWFLKEGLSSVNSTITSRLFNSAVAEAVDYTETNEGYIIVDNATDRNVVDLGKGDRWAAIATKDAGGAITPVLDGENNIFMYSADRDVNKYVAKINGSYFLKNSGTEHTEKEIANDVLFYDSSSGTYSVCQILNAVNSKKMAKDGANNYAKKFDDATMEDIINNVLKLEGANSTFSNVAKEYWLKQMAIKYHDQTVYDYFKANFPDLFKK